MTDAATPYVTIPNDDWSSPVAERQLALLGRLAEAGVEIAVAVEAQAKSGEPFDGQAVAMAYARVSRAVRLSIALQSRIIKDVKTGEVALEQARAEAVEREEQERTLPAHLRKVRVGRIVERLAETEHPDEDEWIDGLVARADRLLDDEDFCGDLMDRPVSEIVARICKQLGLSPDWTELADELWAKDEIATGQPGWPLLRDTS
jgi:hypothetical protein